MRDLILEPTPTAEWQALVEEAATQNHYSITEDLESYLVFLLMRFASSPEIAQSILAIDFLKTLTHLRTLQTERLNTLRDVGDKCLIFAGLFPGRAVRRRVRISYFVRLG